jgi:T4 RnlA family RNA ligase
LNLQCIKVQFQDSQQQNKQLMMTQQQQQYPKITHLNQLLDAIGEDTQCFTIQYKNGFVFIKYKDGFVNQLFPALSTATTDEQLMKFMLRRECRGIVFRENDGKLLVRRFHKFFNLNERPESSIEVINFNRPFMCLEKVDGSLFSPIEYQGRIKFVSQLGFTQHGELVDNYVNSVVNIHKYDEFCKYCIENDMTPCFEYVSEQNRVVIKYEKSELILLAVRKNESGEYISYDQCKQWAKEHKIPIIQPLESISKIASIIGTAIVQYIRDLKGIEGCVIIFLDTYEMYKCKTLSYSVAHSIHPEKVKERQLWKATVTHIIDDLVSLIDFDTKVRTALQKFRDEFQQCIENKAKNITKLVERCMPFSEKKLDSITDKYDKTIVRNVLSDSTDLKKDQIMEKVIEEIEKYILEYVDGNIKVFTASKSSLYKWLNLNLKSIHPYHFESTTGVLKMNSSVAKSKSSATAVVDESYTRLNNKLQKGKKQKDNKKGSNKK